MKRRGCACLGCLGALGLGLVAAGVLLLRGGPSVERDPRFAPEPGPSATPRPRPTSAPTPDPDTYLENAGELRDFERALEGDRYRLSYGFVDYQARAHRVSCTVARADVLRQQRSFGYVASEIERLENQGLVAVVEREIERRGLAPHFRFAIVGDKYRWGLEIQGEPSLDERARLWQAARELEDWLDRNVNEELERVRTELYAARGFKNRNRTLSIDYARIVRESTAPLDDCFQALDRSASGSSERQRLGMLLAFFQELAYELPPDRDGRRETMGFWTPTEVLVRGRGDCDSKSAAFAALWRHYSSSVVLIVLPKHVLVGVEGRPGPGERHVRLGNRYYLLCEPAGPGKLHPGSSDMSGSYEYVTIEPLRPGAR